MIKKLHVSVVKKADRYPIIIGCNSQSTLKKYIVNYRCIVMITDHRVKKAYGIALKKYLSDKHVSVNILSFQPGEASKTIETKSSIENKMMRLGVGRDSLIIALGGGVVGDLAGFIAATYMRGIPYIHIPTTLMAMIDSSIGGKTAVDTAYGKNLIGAFWQPTAVFIDTGYLTSLPLKQKINGLIEAIKIFLVADRKSFTYLTKNLPILLQNDSSLAYLIEKAVKLKATIVRRDPYETNRRMVLNFGHTIGHAIEKATDYKMLHGYAVGVGLLVESHIALTLGVLDSLSFEKIQTLLHHYGINGKLIAGIRHNEVIKWLRSDKKTKNDVARFVLLKRIGSVFCVNGQSVHAVPDKLVKQSLRAIAGAY